MFKEQTNLGFGSEIGRAVEVFIGKRGVKRRVAAFMAAPEWKSSLLSWGLGVGARNRIRYLSYATLRLDTPKNGAPHSMTIYSVPCQPVDFYLLAILVPLIISRRP